MQYRDGARLIQIAEQTLGLPILRRFLLYVGLVHCDLASLGLLWFQEREVVGDAIIESDSVEFKTTARAGVGFGADRNGEWTTDDRV